MKQNELGKRVIEERLKRGASQEDLAGESLLSLRTIQRIESGQTIPRGDTLKRLASALKIPVEDLIDWDLQEDINLVVLLNLAQLSFLAFPLFGILVPLIMWLANRNRVRDVDQAGKSILNFQTSWSLLLFSIHFLGLAIILIMNNVTRELFYGYTIALGGLYSYNLLQIFLNIGRYRKEGKVRYGPAFRFLEN